MMDARSLRGAVLAIAALAAHGPCASGFRNSGVESELAFDLQSANASGGEASGDVLLTSTWAALHLAYDVFYLTKQTHDAYQSVKKRQEAIAEIAGGHAEDVAQVVTAAHAAVGSTKESGAAGIQRVLEGDTFNHLRELLATFRQAEQLCITEESFLGDPLAWVVRKAGQGLPPEQAAELQKAQKVIKDVVESMEAVIDGGICPQLSEAVERDLLVAQQNVEGWEETVKPLSGSVPISWYQMLYHQYTASVGGGAATFLAGMTTAVTDKTRYFSRQVEYPTRESCYAVPGGQKATPSNGVDEFEIVFDSSMPDKEVVEATGKLKAHALAINEAMDRASMNLETFERECKRVMREGKEGLIAKMHAEMKKGSREAAMRYRASTCDYCFRFGCRETGVLDVLHDAYKVARYGVDRLLVKAAKALIPAWYEGAVSAVDFADVMTRPAKSAAKQFWAAALFAVSLGGQQHKARESCIMMGKAMEASTEQEFEASLEAITGFKPSTGANGPKLDRDSRLGAVKGDV